MSFIPYILVWHDTSTVIFMETLAPVQTPRKKEKMTRVDMFKMKNIIFIVLL